MKAEPVKLSTEQGHAETARASGLPALRDLPQRWWLLLLLTLGMVFCYAQRGTLSVATPFLIRELNLSPAAMGLLLSAFSWTYSFMQMPAGWVVDRYGVKRAYSLSFALWSIASAFTGFARTLISLILLRVFMGVAQAAAFPATSRAVVNWFQPKERGTVTATVLTGVRLGQALVGAVGALLIAAYGMKVFFLVFGFLPLFWLLPWTRFLNKWETGPAQSAATPDQPPAQPTISFWKGVALLKHRSVLGIFLGFFAYDYVWFVYTNWLPGYLVLERKFSTKEMGFYSSIPYLIMSVVILLSGFLSDGLIRRGYAEVKVRKTLISLGLLAACLIVPAGLVESNLLAVWLLTAALAGLGIASPNTWTLTQAVCAKKIVGTVSGIQNFGGNIAGIIAPALTGYIAYATKSFALALGISGAVLVAGIFAYIFLINERVEVVEAQGASGQA